MASVLDLIRGNLITASLVMGTTGWKCYAGFCPDDEDKVVSLHSTGGYPQDTLGNENVLETVQIRVRGVYLDPTVCEAKWWAVFNALQDATISGIGGITALASGPLTYYDEKNRPNMTMNFRIIRPRPS